MPEQQQPAQLQQRPNSRPKSGSYLRNNREASLNGGAISPALSAQAGSPVAGTNPSDSNANDGPKTQFNSAEVSQYLQRIYQTNLDQATTTTTTTTTSHTTGSATADKCELFKDAAGWSTKTSGATASSSWGRRSSMTAKGESLVHELRKGWERQDGMVKGQKINLNNHPPVDSPSATKSSPTASLGNSRNGTAETPRRSSGFNFESPSSLTCNSSKQLPNQFKVKSQSSKRALYASDCVYLNSTALQSLDITPGSYVLISKEAVESPETADPSAIIPTIAQVSFSAGPADILLPLKFRQSCSISLGSTITLLAAERLPTPAYTISIKPADPQATALIDVSHMSILLKTLLVERSCCTLGMHFSFQRSDDCLLELIVDGVSTDQNRLENHMVSLTLESEQKIQIYTVSLDCSVSIIFGDDDPSSKAITYDDIGGLDEQISILKDLIDLPLKNPSLFSRFNMRPSRGVLLYGPPGSGKTMLLKALATQIDANVFTINGPTIVSKFVGETESRLRGIFAEAERSQPSIIFIDEVDALVPKRDGDDSPDSGRTVSTLLTLMDGMDMSRHVVVIAATNRPNAIDPALRRPGRFDREIEVGIPNSKARHAILEVHLRDAAHKLDTATLFDIADRTHGFVGADIMSLCHQSGLQAIKRGLSADLPEDDIYIEPKDVEEAFSMVRASAMREIFLETPKVRWSDVGGSEWLRSKLEESVQWPLIYSESFKRLGIAAPKGILLYGPPGCSKTLTAQALATEAGLNFIAVKGSEMLNKYVGESERAIREVFRKARAASPSIIFFDEIDAITASRDENRVTDGMVASLLNEMDGIESLKNVFILAATNKPTEIDPALLRPGRLDRLVYVGLPNSEVRQQILKINFRRMSVGEDVDLLQLAHETEGCSGAEIAALCQDAGLEAMHDQFDAQCILQEHFNKALKHISKQTTMAMLEYYDSFQQKG